MYLWVHISFKYTEKKVHKGICHIDYTVLPWERGMKLGQWQRWWWDGAGSQGGHCIFGIIMYEVLITYAIKQNLFKKTRKKSTKKVI